MRLIKTQASSTRHYLKQALAITMNAIDKNDYKMLQSDLEGILDPLPQEALDLINDLALYEAEYTVKKIRKYIRGRKNLKIPIDSWILQNVKDLTIQTSVGRPAQTITDTYQSFVDTKIQQIVRAVEDSDEEDEDLKDSISGMVGGLFTVQNLALAGLAVIGAANMVRSDVAETADLYVQWVTMMDDAVCDDCEAMEGSTYKAGEEPDDIPLHANCRCTWDIVE